jgi:hypothetical protein
MRSDSAEPVTARPTGYWQDDGTGKQSNSYVPNRSIKEVLGCPLRKRFRELLGEVGFPPNGVVSMWTWTNWTGCWMEPEKRRWARPIATSSGALHALAAMLVRPRHTEKTSAVLEEPGSPEAGDGTQPDTNVSPQPGHGRNGAEAFGGAGTVDIAHQKLTHGNRCPECGKGDVYGQKEPKVLVRIVGRVPLAAAVYSLERLRCGACGQVFTAQEPEGVGPDGLRIAGSGQQEKWEGAANRGRKKLGLVRLETFSCVTRSLAMYCIFSRVTEDSPSFGAGFDNFGKSA